MGEPKATTKPILNSLIIIKKKIWSQLTMSDYKLKVGLLGTNCPNDTNSRLKFNILYKKKKNLYMQGRE